VGAVERLSIEDEVCASCGRKFLDIDIGLRRLSAAFRAEYSDEMIQLPLAAWRVVVLMVCLMASTVQGFIAQTHGHRSARPRLESGVRLDAPSVPLSKLDACPLCQVGLTGSVPLRSVDLIFMASMARLSSPAFSRGPTPLIAAVSYSWQSRGPPLI
jgi:hypothetical protein